MLRECDKHLIYGLQGLCSSSVVVTDFHYVLTVTKNYISLPSGAHESCLLSSAQSYESERLIVLGNQGNSRSNDLASSSTVQFVSYVVNLFTCFTANVTAWRLTILQEALGQYQHMVSSIFFFNFEFSFQVMMNNIPLIRHTVCILLWPPHICFDDWFDRSL